MRTANQIREALAVMMKLRDAESNSIAREALADACGRIAIALADQMAWEIRHARELAKAQQ
jgi:hypothetical protein